MSAPDSPADRSPAADGPPPADGPLLPALTDLPVEGYAALAEVPGARRHNAGQVRRWVPKRCGRAASCPR